MKDLLVKLSRRVSFKKILRPLAKRTQNDKGGVLRLRLGYLSPEKPRHSHESAVQRQESLASC